MELLFRFLLGGLIVCLFSVVGDVVRPKGFAGLFGAAPSVALATIALTLSSEGKPYAALESRSMIAGAAAFLLYAVAVVYVLTKRDLKVAPAAVGLLAVWLIGAFGFWSVFLR
ncbi:MAG TPA: DUF3147 family protein [Steroidobacteraceae bacterium]|jgi:uncharacterized membrane protein (GlpM family)|nr:DUF3147 family protein [Steroidobacteraceae bacterium]